MEQRRLRLGDILDDYCPRERRVTNHAVVAMVEDKVQQTRCTTCDAEHVYKGGKAPRRRARKDSPEGLFREVLAGMPDGDAAQTPIPVIATPSVHDDERSVDEMLAAAAPAVVSMSAASPAPALSAALAASAALATSAAAEAEAAPQASGAPEPGAAPEDDVRGVADDGPFHRRLIRAQLPRIEGQKDVRQEPDFSFRTTSNGTRVPAPFRGVRGHGGASSNGRGGQPNSNAGNRPGGRRFAGGGNPGTPGSRGPGGPNRGPGRGAGPGQGRGGRPGFGGPSNGPGRGPSNGPGRGGPRKRSR